MKNLMLLLLALMTSTSLSVWAEEEAASASIGIGKAIIEADEHEQKFKLSDAAIKKLQIRFEKIVSSERLVLPLTSLVEFRDQTGVFRKDKNGFVQMLNVTIIRRNEKQFSVTSPDLKAGDEIAVSGVPLIRAAQLDAFEEAAGHGH